MIYYSSSDKQTKELARKLAKSNYKIIALSGDLGAGKTTFVQGFAEGLGIKEKIISPTFVLIRQHQIPKTKKTFYHIDLYRLDNENSFSELGIEDLFNSDSSLVLIEWAEKIEKNIPKDALRIIIDKVDETKRKITVLS